MTRNAWAGLVALCSMIFGIAGIVSSFFTPVAVLSGGTQATIILLGIGMCCGFWFIGFRYGRGE
jgi:uncharacterized membrane protein